jgi:hypothetical protein
MRISYLILQPPSPLRLLQRPSSQPQQSQSQQSQPSPNPPRTSATRSRRRYLPQEHMNLFGSFKCIQYAPAAEYRFWSHSFDNIYPRKRRRESTQSNGSSHPPYTHNAGHHQDVGAHPVPTTAWTRENRSSNPQDSTSSLGTSEIPEGKRRRIEHSRQMELERTFLLLPLNVQEKVLVR